MISNSLLLLQKLRTSLFNLFFVILFFFLGVNTFFPFPLDKIVMTGSVVLMLIFSPKYNISSIIILLSSLAFFFISFIVNFPSSSFIIFFPVIGVLFSFYISKIPNYINFLFYGTIIHVIVAVILIVFSYLVKINDFVHPLYDKGLPFLHAPEGFTSTVQTFATLCILIILIYYFKIHSGGKVLYGKLLYFLTAIALLMTFNRNYFVVMFFILFFKERRIFYLFVFGLIAIYFSFFDFFNSLILNTSTISSRGRLLEAFRISFFERTNILEYLIGHGNNVVDDSIAVHTYYKTGYIENGLSVLLYTYGLFGFTIYLIGVVVLTVKVYKNAGFFFAFLCGYVFLISQQFTHEYFSTTFYLLLSFFIYVSQFNFNNEKEDYNISLIK